MELLHSLMPVVEVYSIGTAVLDFPGVSSKGIINGTFGTRLDAPPPDGTVPPPPPMAVVSAVVETAMDLVDLAILMVNILGVRQ